MTLPQAAHIVANAYHRLLWLNVKRWCVEIIDAGNISALPITPKPAAPKGSAAWHAAHEEIEQFFTLLHQKTDGGRGRIVHPKILTIWRKFLLQDNSIHLP